MRAHFELLHKAWQMASKKGELDFNAYFQNSATFGDMVKKNKKKLSTLSRQTKKIFTDYLY